MSREGEFGDTSEGDYQINNLREDDTAPYSVLYQNHQLSLKINVFGFKMQKNLFKTLIAITVVVLCCAIWLSSWSCFLECAEQARSEISKLGSAAVAKTTLPKILWIYTRGDLMAQHANTLIYYYHLNETASKLGYEVRVVNSWTAYQWLHNQSVVEDITTTIQKTLIDETVDNLLKLALLIENGGVLIGNLNVVVNKDLKWVEDMFTTAELNEDLYTCHHPELYMIQYSDKVFGIKFYQDFIAAVPQSVLLKQAFEILKKTLLTGKFPGNYQLRVMTHRDYTNVDQLPYAIDNCVSYLVFQYLKGHSEDQQGLCSQYGLQRTQKELVFDLNQFPKKERAEFMFKGSKRVDADLIINTNTTSVNQALGELIVQPKSISHLDADSVMYMVLQAKGNKQIFFDPVPNRKNLEICAIVIDDLKEQEVFQMYHMMQNQVEANWTLAVFVKEMIRANIQDERLQIRLSQGNQIRNIEIAVTQVCSKKGYALLLHEGDSFNSEIALSEIAEAFEPQWIVGGAINLQFNGQYLNASEKYLCFSRSNDGIVNPKIDIMEGILNHFRLFSVEAFRYIPQFDHTDIFGNYFKDRIIFLMTLLEMIENPRDEYEQIYIYRRYYQQFNIPRQAILIEPDLRIKTKYFDRVNREQITKTKARYDAEPISKTIEEINNFDIPFDKLLVFNPGNKWVSVDDKKGPDIIPKVIHQAWLGSKLGVAQQYFLKKTMVVYPNYEVKLWAEPNITRQNFPMTYDLILNLLDFHKNRKSTFHKLATVTDIMRHEILYHQGGFWKDAGMNLLKPIFDKFLKYQLVIGAERSLRHRWNQGMCFFANVPKSKHMGRITGYPNTNRMRIYGDAALDIAGPFDFRNVIIGYEEYSPQVLIMNFEYFYPGQVGRAPFDDLCTRYEQQYKGEPAHFKHNGCYLLKGCEQLYPEAFGLDHNCFGVSWLKRTPQ